MSSASRKLSTEESYVKIKRNLEFMDALLADLQGTAGVTSFDANEKVNGHESNGKESPSAGKPFSYSPIPPRKPETSVSELDNLLDDLNEKKASSDEESLKRKSQGSTSSRQSLKGSNASSSPRDSQRNSDQPATSGPESLMQQSNLLSTKVEALLDELDSAVAPTPAPVVERRPAAGRAGLSNDGTLPSKTASSATKELDDLMASLSDFRVSVQRDSRVPTLSAALPPEQAAQKEPPPSGMASKTADYAKVDKQPSLKGKSGAAKINQLDSMLGNLQSDMSRQGVATVTKGVCAACSKPIVGQVCTALGRTWHPEHFTCAVCEVPLGTKTFFERDGKPYCEQDYHEQFAPRCSYCEGPILDSCVTAMDQTWHPEHFVCAQCGKPFGESGYHEKDGKPYCRDDYYGLFAPKCSGCDRAIMDNYITALNGHWHPECFVCMECRQPFQGGSFFEHEGMPYCEMHYHARRGSLCYSCQKPITGRCITAMHRKFHPEHFICAFCLKQLNKGTFKEQNDKPYCHSCFVKLFG
ncbi:paxillin-like isoform X1 [Rhopilema esculentum]|uniref:paxillin-like isoform X1 n=1 Tax=Rhopilema esculentum TaxID=499914 RepID=UPI0031D90ABA